MKLNHLAMYDIDQALKNASVGPDPSMPLAERWDPCPDHPLCFVSDLSTEHEDEPVEPTFSPKETD